LLDWAPGLQTEAVKNRTKDLWNLVQDYSQRPYPRRPAILFSHVPLGQREHRESLDLIRSAGYSYQTTLSDESTDRLIKSIDPELVFSGDAHFFTYYSHNWKTKEQTVDTFSWTQGNLYPGASVISIGEPPSKADHRNCVFHNQLKIFMLYGGVGFLLCLGIGFVEFRNYRVTYGRKLRNVGSGVVQVGGVGCVIYALLNWAFL